MQSGIINVYKEAGFTSFDVVAKLRGILHIKKIGHTGTLDPDAVGVLPVCIGKATKVCELLTNKDKVYEATMLLGIATDTEDISGNVLEQHDVNVTEENVMNVLNSFIGESMQVPPMYSALKVNGKKLYEYARAGVEIERAARKICIYSIDNVKIEFPRVTFTVSCSKGTYIRSLCRDIGEKLSCKACMESLKRTKVSVFDIKDSITLAEIEELVNNGEIEKYISSIDSLFMEYPEVCVKEEFRIIPENGGKLYAEHLPEIDFKEYSLNQNVRVYLYDGRFVGIYEYKGDCFAPKKMFLE